MLLRHELQVADVADEPVLAHLPVVDAALESLVAALRVRHHGLSRDTVARQASASQQRRAQTLEGLARALQGVLVDYQRGVDEELDIRRHNGHRYLPP